MTSKMVAGAGKKLFEKHLEQYAPADPLYEVWADERGQTRRRKRELPPGLSARDAKILTSVKKRAHYLDKGFNICGFRFGWTFIIGIIPGVGDVADAILGYYLVVQKCRQAELPNWLVKRMLMNVAVSGILGLFPALGDIFLAVYKVNSRNAALLEEYLRIRGEEYLKLRAKGKDIAVVAEPSSSTGQKDKGKEKSEEVGEDAKKSDAKMPDADQVKPGAGLEVGETIPSPEVIIPVASPDEATPVPTKSPGGTKRRGFLDNWRKRNGPEKSSPVKDRGKFIEHVNSEGSSSVTPKA